jgi:hypothetical protein
MKILDWLAEKLGKSFYVMEMDRKYLKSFRNTELSYATQRTTKEDNQFKISTHFM